MYSHDIFAHAAGEKLKNKVNIVHSAMYIKIDSYLALAEKCITFLTSIWRDYNKNLPSDCIDHKLLCAVK